MNELSNNGGKSNFNSDSANELNALEGRKQQAIQNIYRIKNMI